MSFAPVPRVTEETLALQQLAAAQRALELGNQDLAKAKEDHEKASIELEHDYVQKKNRTREQVKEDNRKAMKSARRSYESAQKSRDSAVRKAEREVEDKQKNWTAWRSRGLPKRSWNGLSWSLIGPERIWRTSGMKRT